MVKKKNKSSPLLSICIPTFNRKDFLETLITQLVHIINNHHLDIEVCISDNHSDDGTWEFLEELSFEYPQFSITQQDQNIGGDKNQLAVARLASAEWILIVGDDDIFMEENLIELLKELPNLGTYDFILLNTKISDNKNLISLDHGHVNSDNLKDSLKNSIFEYGFMGSHLMSKKVASEKNNRDYKELRSWSGFSTFIYSAAQSEIYFHSKPVIWQDANGQAMTWQPTHWFQLSLRMLQVLIDSSKRSKDTHFSKDIVAGNIFSIIFFKNYYSSFLYKKEETFNVIRSEEYLNVLSHLPMYIRLMHKVICHIIIRIPNAVHHFFVKRVLNKDIGKYIFTGNVDERDGVSKDPNILNNKYE